MITMIKNDKNDDNNNNDVNDDDDFLYLFTSFADLISWIGIYTVFFP